MSSRTLSYTEISTALSCQAKWDFRYSDQLAGSSLRSKAIAPQLQGGRAWGAAVAAYHASIDQEDSGTQALTALNESLEADADQQREHGVHDQEAQDELKMGLLKMLMHYIDLAPVVEWERLEERIEVPIQSRSGKRASSRYRFLGFVDAVEPDEDEESVWLNEVKLRASLQPVEQITLSRQIRWYSWAYREKYGTPVKGVYVNERLNAWPKPARLLASGKPSHAKDQMTTVDQYVDLCAEHHQAPSEVVVDALRTRRWQQRVPVLFREGELEEAAQELVSAARYIGALDSGELFPLRNVDRHCRWCDFRDVCPVPDNELVEALFERVPAKRTYEMEGSSP